MIPILFDAKATTFTTNGIGRLSDCISCVVREERNGEYEMEMEYPITGRHYSDLANSRIIVVKASQSSGLQAFRIYKITRPLSGVVLVFCRHISYQLSFIPFKSFSAQSLAGALAGFKTNALETCPFTLTADFTSTSSFAVPLPASIRSYLGGREGSIIDVYGGGAEWEWDNYNCKLHAHRGSDKGVVLRYGKNIIDVEQETNIENTITGIMPYWTSDEVTVTLAAPVESSAAGNFPFPRTVVMDFSDHWENAPTQAQLTAYTQSYIQSNNIGIPKVSIDVEFINLADTEEYKDIAPLETVSLCDTITVEFAKLGISAKAKVVKTEYDVLRERYNEISIGDARSTLSSTIEEQMTAINQRPTIDQTQVSIDRATGVLNSGLRGHVIINRNQEGWANEILFLDDANIAKAKNVLRINNNGIGFSSEGYNSGNYSQSWTIDGHLGLGGVNNASGDLTIYDASTPRPKKLGEWNNAGLQFFDEAQKALLVVNHGGMFLYDSTGKKVLAQLTNAGLDVFDGSIRGGYIDIGNGTFTVDKTGKVNLKSGSINIANKFSVTDKGIMTAVDGNFTGAIKGGTININNKFVVDDKAELKATFTGGNITLGKNFSVTDKGIMTATGATFSGLIKASEININENFKVSNKGQVDIKSGEIKLGQNFSVDNDGNMTATNGTFNGGVITIKGKNGDVFRTGVDEDGYQEVHLGKFRVWEAGEGAYLGSEDKEVFIGDNENMCFVTGWDGETYATGDPESNLDNSNFGVVIDYENVYAQELYLNNSIFEGSTHYWGVGETIDDLYNSSSYGVKTLESDISSLETRVKALENKIKNLSGGGS